MGAITDVVKRQVPASYLALVGATNNYFGGITELQAIADYVKFRLFSTSVAAGAEATVYDLKQIQLLGTLTTLQFIPAAIDYYATQVASESLMDPSESRTYRDPRPELWNIFEKLTAQAEALGSDLGVGVLGAKGVLPKISYGDNGQGVLLTPDPRDFAAEYDPMPLSAMIPWGTP